MNNAILFSTDDIGGAGKAALRIVKALNQSGINCKMLVKNKTTNDNNVIKIRSLTKFKYNQRIKNFINRKAISKISFDSKYYYFGSEYDDIPVNDIAYFIDFIPDTIIVTWIAFFISPRTIHDLALRYKANIVLYPMDMSLFTGGCHYAWECTGYKYECQKCPAIVGNKFDYIAVDRLAEKKKYWTGSNVEFWACSNGVNNEIAISSLAVAQKIENVFIPIDEEIFNAKNRNLAKSIFNIPADNKVILFGSTFSFEARKGISYFIESINLLYDKLSIELQQKTKIIVAGRKDKSIEDSIPFNIIDIEFVKDNLLLSHLYQASDVLICPSIQDSGPMMINEAQMCGLPVIAFNIGVAPDFIINGTSGYLCDLGNVEQMCDGIENIVSGKIIIDNQEIAVLAKNKTSFSAFNHFITNSQNG